MTEDNGNGIKERISVHERITSVEVKLSQIMSNHLPHLQKELEEINTKFYGIVILLVANLVALLVNYINK